MRILCLTSRLPYPPNRGDRLRAFHFLESLSRRHELHLLSFVANNEELTHVKELKTICEEVQVVKMSKLESIGAVGRNLWQSLPLQTLYYRSNKMKHLVNDKLSANVFDATYVHLFRMAPYVEDAPGIYRIIDLTDVISREITRSMPYRSLPSRLLYTLERPRICRYEIAVAQRFEEIWLISEEDQRELVGNCPKSNIQIVTNGIDAKRFFPNGDIPFPHSIIFTGHFGVAHNIDAAHVLARQVLPLVQASFPDCMLNLVGAEPSSEVLKLNNLQGVRVTGFVPDLNIYLNQAAVFAAPLRFAAGIQNKVLEAMAAGRPIVTTSIVNEGIKARPGKELMIADTPQEMASTVIDLFRQPTLSLHLGESARYFVISRYSWDIVLNRVNQIEENLKKHNINFRVDH